VSWEFEDGGLPVEQATSGATVAHSFIAPGTYNVVATVTNSSGSATGTRTITVGSATTLARAVWTAMADAATGVTYDTGTANLFVSGTTRNPSNWLAAWDWTARCYNCNATAVTRRHVVYATHYGIPDSPQWVNASGSVTTGTVVSRRQVSGDLSVATLSADLPAGVTPALFSPSNLADYFDPELEARIPAVILPWNTGPQTRSVGLQSRFTWGPTVHEPESKRWNYLPSGGDSGSPVFIIIDGQQPILLSSCFFAGMGPEYGAFATALDAITTADGYPLTYPDLSGFSAYLA
jgi:hypothetical protein